MVLFETNSLIVRPLIQNDQAFFIELLSNPEIIDPVPQAKMSDNQIMEKFTSNVDLGDLPRKNKDNIWGITEKHATELIGLCGLLTNDEGDWEIAYRFRPKYWGKGYGSETAKGIIDHSFSIWKLEKLTADVDIKNLASVKILNKYMEPVREFFNQKDNCTDRRYHVFRNNWI